MTETDPAPRELFDSAEIGERVPIPTGGYAARPGTGPAGETCRTCRHFRRRTWQGKVYCKCKLVPETAGAETDINAGAPACWGWEENR